MSGDSERPDDEPSEAASRPEPEAEPAPQAPDWWARHRMLVVLSAAAALAVFAMARLLTTSDPFVGQATDIISGRHPRWAFLHQQFRLGEYPLWMPYVLGGVPLQTSPGGQSSPVHLVLRLLFPPFSGLKLDFLLGLAIAAVGAAWWAAQRTRGVWPPLMAAVVYGLSSFQVMHSFAGHDRITHVAAVLPWLLGWLERACQGRLSALAVSALLSGWLMLIGHHHVAYIVFLGLGLYLPLTQGFGSNAELRWRPALGSLGVLAVVVAAGVLLSMLLLLPGVETVALSHRSEPSLAFHLDGSAEPVQLLTYLWPNLLGNQVTSPIAGEWRYQETLGYVGIAPLLLALVAPGVLGWRRALPGLVLIAFGLVIALGDATPLFEWFLAVAPQATAFRSWGRMVLLVTLGVAVLAAFTLDRWLHDEPSDRKGWLVPGWLLLLALAGAWVAWGGMSGGDWRTTFGDRVPGDEVDKMSAPYVAALARSANTDLLRAMVLAGVTVAALFVGTRLRKQPWAAALIVLLTCGERVWDAQMFLRPGPAEYFEWPADAMAFLEERYEPGLRMIVDRELHTSARAAPLGIGEVGGYSSFSYGPYIRYMARSQGLRSLDEHIAYLSVRRNNSMVGRLGSRFLLTRRQLPTRRLRGFEDWRPVGYFEHLFVYQDPAPQPRAFVVHRAVVADEATVFDHMANANFDLRSAAFVEEPLPAALEIPHDPAPDPATIDHGDRAEIARLEADEVELAVRARSRGLVVLSDTWHTGWRAEVDGNEAPVLLVNRFMRAVPVESGKHTVVMRYQPTRLYVGLGISLASLAAVLGFWFWALRRERARGAIGAAAAAALVCMLGCATAEEECEDDVDRLGACGRAPAEDVCSNATDRCYTACNAQVRCDEWPLVDQGQIPPWLDRCWWACVPTFACVDDGHEIDVRWLCDGDKDCVDGSDEDDCEYHECGDGRLINSVRKCDRFPNCDDRSDELDCDYYLCLDNSMTVTTEQRCDGTDDCEDGSDEFNCPDAGASDAGGADAGMEDAGAGDADA